MKITTLVITGAVLMLLGLDGCLATHPEAETRSLVQTSGDDLFDIHQARKSLIGKPEPLVVQAIGIPDRQAGGGRWEWWMYENKFHDLITQRTIPEVTLAFKDGTLVDITY